MLSARLRGIGFVLVAAAIGSALLACSPAAKKSSHLVADASDYGTDDPGDPTLPPARQPDVNGGDPNALGAGERERDAQAPKVDGSARPQGGDDSGIPAVDDAGTSDDGGPVNCPGPLAAGDLAIVEFMIQTQSGAGDRGEWVEIQSTRNCILNLNGLHVESPRGSEAPDAVDVTDDLFLGPNETIVVADSASSDVNHGLPGTVLSWIASDALKNDGDTITVSAGGVTIDTITYGSFTPHIGRSVSFPVDCAWSDRSNWGRWSWAFHPYASAPGDAGASLEGTPNADNDDVACY